MTTQVRQCSKIIQKRVSNYSYIGLEKNHPIKMLFGDDLALCSNIFLDPCISTLDKATLFLDILQFDCKLANEFLAISHRYKIQKLPTVSLIYHTDVLMLPIYKYKENEYKELQNYIKKWRIEHFPNASKEELSKSTFSSLCFLFRNTITN